MVDIELKETWISMNNYYMYAYQLEGRSLNKASKDLIDMNTLKP